MLTSAVTKTAVALLITVNMATWYPGGGEFKCYEDYRALTDTSAPQYQLQREAWTDCNGLRRIGSYYCIALGSAYGSEIGDKYIITLSSGYEFMAVLADQKADRDTIDGHTRDINGAVLEFVVDTAALPQAVRSSGDISMIGGFSGSVEQIRRVK